ncbi:MAG: hypothetical protein ABFD90_15990 [Phycisphaerales bacterium]
MKKVVAWLVTIFLVWPMLSVIAALVVASMAANPTAGMYETAAVGSMFASFLIMRYLLKPT